MICSSKMIWLIISSLLLLSCNTSKENDKNRVDKKVFYYRLDTTNAVLQITKDDNDFYILVSDTSAEYKYLNAINGCGNCYIDLSDATVVRKVNLSAQKQNEYSIIAGVNGSTFGAEYLFIVWNDGTEWNITRAPFHKFEISRIGNQDEIINYTLSNKEETYQFEDGQFLKKK